MSFGESIRSRWELITIVVTLGLVVVYAENLRRDQELINNSLMAAIELERQDHNSILLTVEEVRTAQGEIIGRLAADGSFPYRLGYDVGRNSCNE